MLTMFRNRDLMFAENERVNGQNKSSFCRFNLGSDVCLQF